MKIEQIYTGCLAQGAYYVTSGSEAIIIDPLREITPYMSRAQADGMTIKYILETHFHADFVSGHLDLAKATGAPIIFGPLADPQFAFHSAKDGELLPFGDCSVRVLHTPGHTMESTCYLLLDENGREHALFSGDTLFIGDVGRPDLAQKSAAMTQEELAGTLFDSLRTKILPLADHIIVYPAHGAGSSCGKNMSKETFDTLGNQKKVNYALRSDMDRNAFIKELTNGLLPPPSYFGMNVAMNKKGYDSIHDVMARGLKALRLDEFTSLAPEALILDTRPATEFAQGFIPGSIFIGLEGQFAPWVGALIPDVKQEIILVTPDGKEEETVRRLARVGYDNVRGYLDGGIRAWNNSLDSIGRVEASEVEQGLHTNELLIDVRKPGEYESEHLVDVPSIPLDFINERMAEFPKDKELVLLCGGGYRSMIAASILKARGFVGIKDVIGGYAALAKTDLPKVSVACASTQS
ncbi:MAG: rhodanese-like domain-containing protein [Flavobacteriia bacterium]|nr:rhodanese-like domain-containing protein [Flavobacteriia bacterium]